tara:strand:+ start:98 stop:922 length:825 start_codon:yes stop_codon:yes gene_type:complete
MQNSSESEKSKGVVVFAFNTQLVDYVAIADLTSRLTSKFLKLPITLITDLDADPKFDYDNVIRVEYAGNNFRPVNHGGTTEWKNFGRYLAYELSPYDETILLDGDYLTLDDSLLKLWHSPFDYKLMYNSTTPDGRINNKMSTHGLDYVWATVVLFRKTTKSKMLFDFIGKIQRNYPYYKTLYNGDGSYRNDYAFAIADMVLNGYSINQQQGIPWEMMTIENPVSDIIIKGDKLLVREYERAVVTPWQNLHIMDKKYLQHEYFARFVNEVTDVAP